MPLRFWVVCWPLAGLAGCGATDAASDREPEPVTVEMSSQPRSAPMRSTLRVQEPQRRTATAQIMRPELERAPRTINVQLGVCAVERQKGGRGRVAADSAA